MIKYKEILIDSNEINFYTKGLSSVIDNEIRLAIGNQKNNDYVDVIKYIVDYVINSKSTISDNESIAYYSWFL
jgi:hypothetical protein